MAMPRPLSASLLILGVITLSLHGPSVSLAAAEEAAPSALRVVVEEGRLTVNLPDVRLARVLRLIGMRAGVAIAMRGDLSARVTEAFVGVPLDEGIRRLVRGHSAVLYYSPSRDGTGPPVLSRVAVIGSLAGGPRQARADLRERTRLPTTETLARGSATDAVARGSTGGPPGFQSEPGRHSGATGERSSRLDALQTLARQPAQTAAADLAQVLAEDADPLVRAQAAALLGIVGGEEVATALSAAFADEEASVRLHAVRALGRVEGARALPALREVLARDPDPRVRRVAVRWVAALPGEEARAVLEAAASDRDASVRQEVAAALAIWRKPIR